MSTTDTTGATSSPPHDISTPSSPASPDVRRSNATPTGQSNNLNSQSRTGRESGAVGPIRSDDQPCQACGAFPARFQCSACQGVRYCSQECQTEDWRIHYRECPEIIEARKEEQSRRSNNNGDASGGSTLPRSGAGGTDPLGSEAENVRAIANQPRRLPREPRRRPRLTPEQRAAYEEAERIADMKFYMLQVYKIIKPVVVCICLSILWVKISLAGSDYRPTESTYTVYNESSTSTVAQNFVGSLANAGIIIGQIVIVTIIIVVLFKRGHIKILIGFFMIVVAMLLGFMGYILVLNLIQVLRIPLDYITMSFALWNFAVGGLLSVFWKGPMWLQQVYLTFMSSLMAFSLTGLAEWTTWMLLALLVIWDLIAVLCPFGPLKILVESSRNQNQEVPALLYTVNAVWFMASPPNSILARGASPSKEVAAEDLQVVFSEDHQESKPFSGQYTRGVGRESFGSGVSNTFSEGEASFSSTMGLIPAATNGSAVGDNIELQERANSRGSVTNPRSESSPLAGRAGQSSRARETRSQADGERNEGQGEEEEEEDDDDGGGLKLGLGDFVFYSLLISRAASFDWVTTMCCMVAVLTVSLIQKATYVVVTKSLL
ncbi:Presenilin-1 [Mortierella sp. AD011]|nr:Presenilin-1 [Mortierella sp. AD010]KAF9392828.1 Presenilin-1 [Mortierella sp. AD011]